MRTRYTLREVVEILGVPRGVVAGFVAAGFVAPERGPRGEHRFAFADLVAMRVARALIAAGAPPSRLARALARLKAQLPAELPRDGLRIESDGHALVVSQRGARWRADSGQYVLAFDVAPSRAGVVAFVDRTPAPDPAGATAWVAQGLADEASDPEAACEAYRRAIAADPRSVAAPVNLGRLLHAAGRVDEARETYERALARGVEDATLCFNLGVALADLGQRERAAEAYARALAIDPRCADAHYNLALLAAERGDDRRALRHFSAYRQLARQGPG